MRFSPLKPSRRLPQSLSASSGPFPDPGSCPLAVIYFLSVPFPTFAPLLNSFVLSVLSPSTNQNFNVVFSPFCLWLGLFVALLSFLKPQPIVSDSWIKIKVDCGCGLDYLLPSNRKNSSSRWTSLARYLPRFIIKKMIVVLNQGSRYDKSRCASKTDCSAWLWLIFLRGRVSFWMNMILLSVCLCESWSYSQHISYFVGKFRKEGSE